jgi:DNA repair exonuclease SbcCD nuclease subunit
MAKIRLIHLADIHLGYTGSTNLVFGENEKYRGRYIREVDIEQSVERLTRTITDEQPPVHIVVVAGDLFHRSTPYPRAVRAAAKMVRTLRKHGIWVVIIDGNHETSSWRQVGSPTGFLREFDAHVANSDKYRVFRDGDWGSDGWRSTELRTSPLAIHALPYRAVQKGDFTGVTPIPGYINVLLTHGRVQGMDRPNSLGRVTEHIHLPVVRRSWDYIALGDWHIHRYQPLSDVPAYYAGSLEALNFGEAASYPQQDKDPLNIRGAIDVRLTLGEAPVVTTLQNVGARPVLRLEPVNAADMDPDALMSILRQRLDSRISEHALV